MKTDLTSCSLTYCEAPSRRWGLCIKHSAQLRRSGVSVDKFIEYEGAHAYIPHIKDSLEKDIPFDCLSAWYYMTEEKMRKFIEEME